MAVAPVLAGFAEQLYQRLAFMATEDPDRGYALAHLCAAIGAQWDELDQVILDADDGTPGWARILDPATCPAFALPWLAQLAGTRIATGMAEVAARQLIADMAGLRRGTPAAIIAAARSELAPANPPEPAFVRLLERDTSSYHFTVIVRTVECPDSAKVETAIRAQKPIGLMFTLLVVDGWTIGEMEDAYASQAISDLEGDFASIGDLEDNNP